MGLPRSGVPKRSIPAATVTITSNSPIARYGRSLPSTISSRDTGVAASCSIVPRSHSRAMVRAVSSAAMMDMMIAISPGTIIVRLSRSGLYQTRDSARTGGGRRRPSSRTRAEYRATIASA